MLITVFTTEMVILHIYFILQYIIIITLTCANIWLPVCNQSKNEQVILKGLQFSSNFLSFTFCC